MYKRYPQTYSFEKRLSVKRLKSGVRKRIDVALIWEENIYDPDDSELGEKIIPKVLNVYWKFLLKLYGNNCALLLKLDGLHLNVQEAKSQIFEKNSEASVVVHFHNWAVENYVEKDGFCIVNCNKALFRFLFERYWFSPGAECRLQGFIFEKKYAPFFFSWVGFGNCNSKRKYEYFLKKALLVIDNLHNGFHFRMETTNKSMNLEKLVAGFKERSKKKER